MPDPASSGRRRVGLAQFHRDMERATAPLREMERVMWRATGPLRMAEAANKRMSRIVAALAPGKLTAELLGEVEAPPPPRHKKPPHVAADASKPDPARPPRSTGRPKAKKPRGKTANERLRELWETAEGRRWLLAEARSVGEVANRIGRKDTQTKRSKMWIEIIGPRRKLWREELRREAQERYWRRQCGETDRYGAA